MSDYTKIDIAMALDDLLKKKPLSDITISDIANRAGVNRQTFYYHFKNIYNLLEWSVNKDIEEYLAYCKENSLEWKESLIYLATIIKENRTIILNAYECLNSKLFRTYLNAMADPIVNMLIKEKLGGRKIGDEEMDGIVTFFQSTLIGYFLLWIDSDEPIAGRTEKVVENVEISIEAICRHISEFV